MLVTLSVRHGFDDQLIFAQQLGINQVIVQMEDWSKAALASARNRVEQTGLRLAAFEGLVLNGNETDVRFLENIGHVGIDLVSCSFGRMNTPAERKPAGRGHALVRHISDESAQLAIPPNILRAANTAEVRIAAVAGASAAISVIEDVTARGIGLDLDLSEMSPDQSVQLAQSNRIYLVRAVNWSSTESKPREAFLDEGEVPIPRRLLELHRSGYDGLVRAAAPPGMVADTGWGHKGRAFDTGYLKAIIQALS